MEMLISVMLFFGIIVSLKTRIKMLMWRSDPPSGALAKAITQLVGTAGGIYLSLELLFTFLGLPEEIWNPSSIDYVKPLAVFSFFIAILQPYGQKLLAYIQQRRT